MRRWQYKVVVTKVLSSHNAPDMYDDTEREAILNSYGRDGWELVSVVFQRYRKESDPIHSYGFTNFSYYFKREIETS